MGSAGIPDIEISPSNPPLLAWQLVHKLSPGAPELPVGGALLNASIKVAAIQNNANLIL
jgi:hypothetical protein